MLPPSRPTRAGLPEPKRDIRIGPHVRRKQPPVVGDVCQGVATKNAQAKCAHLSATCSGTPAWCPRCAFPYCEHHYPRHVRSFTVPQDVWREFSQRLRAWHEKVGQDPRAKPKVLVSFPEEGSDA